MTTELLLDYKQLQCLAGGITFLVDNEDDDQFLIRIFDQVPTAPTTRDPIRLMYLPAASTIDFTMNNPQTGMPWAVGDRIDEDVYEVVGYQRSSIRTWI